MRYGKVSRFRHRLLYTAMVGVVYSNGRCCIQWQVLWLTVKRLWLALGGLLYFSETPLSPCKSSISGTVVSSQFGLAFVHSRVLTTESLLLIGKKKVAHEASFYHVFST